MATPTTLQPEAHTDAIRAAHVFYVFLYYDESLTVVTTTGKALIPSTGEGFEELRDLIKDIAPVTCLKFSTEHPMVGLVYLFGLLVGAFAGVFLTPRNSSDFTLGLFLLLGAALGVAGSYLLVCHRFRI